MQPSSLSDLNRQFNPRLAVEDFSGVIERRREAGRAVAESFAIGRRRYGGHPLEVFLAVDTAAVSRDPTRPAVVFIHGGYWRSGSPDDNLVIAPSILSSGALPILMGYPLCPELPLPAVIASVARGFMAILAASSELGFDSSRVILAGTSAGAHLAAMLMTMPETAASVSGALLLSGIYDLTPVPLLDVNREIGIESRDVAECSPLFESPRAVRAVLAVGELEPVMWKAQTRAFANLMRASGSEITFIEAKARHHFDLIIELAKADSELAKAFDKLPRRSDKSGTAS